MVGPTAWLSWALPGQPDMACDLGVIFPERERLLDALHKASVSHPQATLVTHHQAEVVWDDDHPEKDLRPCCKLANERVAGTWSLDPDRAQLWDILARHYFHAHEVDHD